MSESKHDQSLDKGADASERAKETHGWDENTPVRDVKGPNMFERVKEEFEAIAESIHPHKQDKNQDSSPKDERHDEGIITEKHEKRRSFADILSKIKQEKGEVKSRGGHCKETHGKGEDIDVNIPVSEFRGPSIFHRAKEEVEAIVDSIHHKKEPESPKKEGGLRASIGKKLDRIYTPKKTHNHDNS